MREHSLLSLKVKSFSKQERKPKNYDAYDWLDNRKLSIFNGEKYPIEDYTFIRPHTDWKITFVINVKDNIHYIQSAPINRHEKNNSKKKWGKYTNRQLIEESKMGM